MSRKNAGEAMIIAATIISMLAALFVCLKVPVEAGKQLERVNGIEMRMEKVETKVDRIPYIESKVDMIYNQIRSE